MQAYASRTGWIMLAAIVMFSVGLLRIISGISYLVDSHKVNDLTLGLFGDNLGSGVSGTRDRGDRDLGRLLATRWR